MRIERFEDIVAWQKAKELSIAIYSQFRDCRDYGFKNQICRAAVSIMNNIAEGFELLTNKEFKQFLFIAKGSSGEVRSMLHLASDLNYISTNQYNQLPGNSTEISRMLSGFINFTNFQPSGKRSAAETPTLQT